MGPCQMILLHMQRTMQYATLMPLSSLMSRACAGNKQERVKDFYETMEREKGGKASVRRDLLSLFVTLMYLILLLLHYSFLRKDKMKRKL